MSDPRLLALAAALLMPLAALAGPVAERVKAAGTVRVCIWPEYYGITFRNPRTQQLVGIDVDMANELGKDLKARVEFVESSFPQLVPDVTGDKCDVAMFAIAITPAREKALRFTRPHLKSDIYGITLKSSRAIRAWEDIDRPGVKVAVQAGTFMEPVMAERLKQATMVVVRPPATREQEVESGRVDVFMTDYPYSRRLLDNADWARLVSPPKPFHIVPYAYAVKPGDEDWWRAVDGFVARALKDGRAAAAAKRHGLAEILARD